MNYQSTLTIFKNHHKNTAFSNGMKQDRPIFSGNSVLLCYRLQRRIIAGTYKND